jgi:REP element-mobilizing transposase RayT
MGLEPKDRRRSIRLQNYDYAMAGAYFFTSCTQDRLSLFGRVRDGKMHLNEAGQMVWEEWNSLPTRFARIILDAFMVMPNHIHGIIIITASAEPGAHTPGREGAAPSLGQIIGPLKSRTTVEYGRGVRTKGWPRFSRRLWQRNYYEHIIRTEDSLNRIRQYILENPLRWHLDRDNPDRTGDDDVWEALFAAQGNSPT